MFGHDECIFKQYTLTNKHWKAPNGATVLIPKDDGQGVMISAFQSREFGFGFDLNQQQLALINSYRKEKDYADEKAAIKLRGTKKNNHSPKPLSSENSSTDRTVKATGRMSTWFCKWKTA
jgi:hypothetical protein